MPLCHPLPITRIAVDFELDAASQPRAVPRTGRDAGRTGVEMEALCAVQVGLLTIHDMYRAADRVHGHYQVRVLEKHGGKSGNWSAP